MKLNKPVTITNVNINTRNLYELNSIVEFKDDENTKLTATLSQSEKEDLIKIVYDFCKDKLND